jgi:hypothetical protein
MQTHKFDVRRFSRWICGALVEGSGFVGSPLTPAHPHDLWSVSCEAAQGVVDQDAGSAGRSESYPRIYECPSAKL